MALSPAPRHTDECIEPDEPAPKKKRLVYQLPGASTESKDSTFISINVNGIRNFIKTGGMDCLLAHDYHTICLQEIKVKPGDITAQLLRSPLTAPTMQRIVDTYPFVHWNPSRDPNAIGLHGTAIFSKSTPLDAYSCIGDPTSDLQGRSIIAVYYTHVISTVYMQQPGLHDEHRHKRTNHLAALARIFKRLNPDGLRPLVLAGDVNVAPDESDFHSSLRGFPGTLLHQRRQWASFLQSLDMVDMYRRHNDASYTWHMTARQRAQGRGLRLDGFWCSVSMTQAGSDVRARNVRHEHALTSAAHTDHVAVSITVSMPAAFHIPTAPDLGEDVTTGCCNDQDVVAPQTCPPPTTDASINMTAMMKEILEVGAQLRQQDYEYVSLFDSSEPTLASTPLATPTNHHDACPTPMVSSVEQPRSVVPYVRLTFGDGDFGSDLQALIDSGADVNCMTMDVLAALPRTSYTILTAQLSAIRVANNSMAYPLAVINTTIKLRDETVQSPLTPIQFWVFPTLLYRHPSLWASIGRSTTAASSTRTARNRATCSSSRQTPRNANHDASRFAPSTGISPQGTCLCAQSATPRPYPTA